MSHGGVKGLKPAVGPLLCEFSTLFPQSSQSGTYDHQVNCDFIYTVHIFIFFYIPVGLKSGLNWLETPVLSLNVGLTLASILLLTES